ncbi:putative GTP-binding protein 6 [Clonorchis sinensis]|uniref:GTP-binding protein 6 n=2 Tax=Clonorchis sinensis TaxID=79923 RepID=A0A8T1MTV2_CLOSI|nr:putative GTP-binding protein 6 [Clonorchis sinensis]GAA35393.2 putative GTP-binding protein 6 [Clonorchis sinensis]
MRSLARLVALRSYRVCGLRRLHDDSRALEIGSILHEKLLHETYLLPEKGHSVLIIQPNVKHAALRRRFEVGLPSGPLGQRTVGPSEDEARALVDSLEGWKTVGTVSFALRGIVRGNRQRFFTKGVWEEVTKAVESYRSGQQDVNQEQKPGLSITSRHAIGEERPIATAVFVNWPRLSTLQVATMQNAWSLPVYDRYTLVVQLFTSRAQSQEARIQAQLAELSLLRARLPALFTSHSGTTNTALYDDMSAQQLDRLLREKEARLLAELSEVERRRQLARQHRRSKRVHELPVVTVVGYTNAGKTSLIRCLSGSTKARSSPQVFATLDITHHRARLPTTSVIQDTLPEASQDAFNKKGTSLPGIRFLLLDTIGFMADLPTNLITAFRATLEECLDTDLILHVIDVSEEDWERRAAHVDNVLSHSGVPRQNIEGTACPASDSDLAIQRNQRMMPNPPVLIRIGNKVDLGLRHVNEKNRQKLDVLVSANHWTGLDELTGLIKDQLIGRLGWFQRTITMSQGSPALQWIYSNAMVTNVMADPADPQRLKVCAIFTPAVWQKLQHLYPLRKHQKPHSTDE